MRLATVLLLALCFSITACSEDDASPAAPVQVGEIEFRKVPNTALYGGANYAGMLLYVHEQGSVSECQQMCEEDPECNFFYYNERGGLVLQALTTKKDDCAFFRGKLWSGTANQSDTYVKQIDGVDAWDLAKGRF